MTTAFLVSLAAGLAAALAVWFGWDTRVRELLASYCSAFTAWKNEPRQECAHGRLASSRLLRALLSLGILVVGLITPFAVQVLVEVNYGGIPAQESVVRTLRWSNWFVPLVGLLPFAILSILLFAVFRKRTNLETLLVALLGLGGILGLMIPAHIAVIRPLYTDEHASSTAAVAYLFIPCYCVLSMFLGIGLSHALIALARWSQRSLGNQPGHG